MAHSHVVALLPFERVMTRRCPVSEPAARACASSCRSLSSSAPSSGPGLRGSHGRAGTARPARELDVGRLVGVALGVSRRAAARRPAARRLLLVLFVRLLVVVVLFGLGLF